MKHIMKHILKDRYFHNGKIIRSAYTDYSDTRCYSRSMAESQTSVQSVTTVTVTGSSNANTAASDPTSECGSSSPTAVSENDNESKNIRAVYNAIRTLTDVLDNNFSDGVDKEVTLTVSPDGFKALFGSGPADEVSTMRAAVQKVFRNARLMAARAGIPCKFVWIVSNTDGATGESVRIHAHGVINGALLPLLAKIWLPFGSVNAKSMYEKHHTYAALARYMIKQSCAAPGEKRYSASRNLAKPIEIKREIPANRENIVLSAPPASEMIANPDVFLCYIRATYFSRELKTDYVGYIQRRLNHSNVTVRVGMQPTYFGKSYSVCKRSLRATAAFK